MIGAAISGGSALLSAYGQHSANKENAEIARRNRRFQERMTRNRYTYAVQDLKRAGLNPMMLAGGMASPGQAPSGSTAHMENVARDLPSNVSNAVAASRVRKENQVRDVQIDDVRASADLKSAQAEAVRADTKIKLGPDRSGKRLWDLHSTFKDAELKHWRAELLKRQIELREWDIHSASAAAKKKKAQDELDLEWIKFDNVVKRLGAAKGLGDLIPSRFRFSKGSKKFDRYQRYLKGRK